MYEKSVKIKIASQLIQQSLGCGGGGKLDNALPSGCSVSGISVAIIPYRPALIVVLNTDVYHTYSACILALPWASEYIPWSSHSALYRMWYMEGLVNAKSRYMHLSQRQPPLSFIPLSLTLLDIFPRFYRQPSLDLISPRLDIRLANTPTPISIAWSLIIISAVAHQTPTLEH